MSRNSTLYTLGGTKTFRRGSRKIFGRGSNMQNWEKKVRRVFTSDGWNSSMEAKLLYWLENGDTSIFNEQELNEIRVLLQVDQSGAEALIVAYECEHKDFRELFINNVKPHVYVALKLFKLIWPAKAKYFSIPTITEEVVDELCNIPIKDLRKHPCFKELDKLIKDSDNWSTEERYYYLAKQTCHSANYGIMENKFILNVLEKSGGKIVLDKEQGKYFLETYRALFPEIPARCDKIEMIAKRNKMLFNLFGHPYKIEHEDIPDSVMRELYAWSAQSTVGEITRIAYSRLYEFIRDNNKEWDLLADTHDSYLVQCPLNDVGECSKTMQQLMNQKLIAPSDGTEFYMKSECQIGLNWAPFNKDTNKLGLRELPKWIT